MEVAIDMRKEEQRGVLCIVYCWGAMGGLSQEPGRKR